MLQQLERLQKDSSDLEIYALKLKKRGKLEKMNKILKKKDFTPPAIGKRKMKRLSIFTMQEQMG